MGRHKNRGDDENPNYRIRLVGKEFNTRDIDGLFAGAPPPEAAAQPPPVPMSSYLGGGDDSIERAPTAPSPDPVGPTHYDV